MTSEARKARARRAWRAARRRAMHAPHGVKIRRWAELRRAMCALLREEMRR